MTQIAVCEAIWCCLASSKSTRAWLALAVAMTGLSACGSKTPPEPVASQKVVVAPPDEVDPNALIEGPLDAFGLKLPLRAQFVRQTPMTKVASVPFAFTEVSSYCRQRLEGGKIEVGPQKTIFSATKIKGAEGLFNVVVRRKSLTSEISIQRLIGSNEIVETPESENPDVRPPSGEHVRVELPPDLRSAAPPQKASGE